MSAPEQAGDRLKRLQMRSWRRGIKEMDLILGRFADRELATLGPEELDAYDALLSENDHDLYRWVSGQEAPPADRAFLVARIAAFTETAGAVGPLRI